MSWGEEYDKREAITSRLELFGFFDFLTGGKKKKKSDGGAPPESIFTKELKDAKAAIDKKNAEASQPVTPTSTTSTTTPAPAAPTPTTTTTFIEGEHPRGDGGQFIKKPGSTTSTTKPVSTTTTTVTPTTTTSSRPSTTTTAPPKVETTATTTTTTTRNPTSSSGYMKPGSVTKKISVTKGTYSVTVKAPSGATDGYGEVVTPGNITNVSAGGGTVTNNWVVSADNPAVDINVQSNSSGWYYEIQRKP